MRVGFPDFGQLGFGGRILRPGGRHSFRLDGLDPERNYKVTELNVDRSCWWGDGKEFSGAFLGTGAFNPDLPQKYSSAVFYLEAK